MAKLTHQQKLDALSYRFYQGGQWTPKAGDFYTTSRADLELYQIVSVENGIVRTRFTEGTDAISEWPEAGFLTEGFGPRRVFVPEWVMNAPTTSPQTHSVGLTDTQLIDALAANYWDLRCGDCPTGGDDADIDWFVIEHRMGKPSEIEVARAYADDPRLAIRRALRSTDKNAARCVSCGKILHDGDSVYYEHGEGGHIHAECASEDPENFVDENEVPLTAGDEIPEPFAYSVERYEPAETPSPQTRVDGDPARLKPIPIEAAKRIAKEYGYDQVLIYARRCHDTPEPHGEHMTTYGRTREHCDVAARIGDTLKKFMGWEV